MKHTCEYCNKEITQGTTIEGLKCKCPNECEVPETVICDGALCQFKFQVSFYETKLDELKANVKENEAKLKELNNIFRIMGITPKGLEVLIQTQGVNVPGLMISQNQSFSWDLMNAENLVTIGITFLENYQKVTNAWAQFLNEKAVKVQIKKELLQQSDKKLKETKHLRENKVSVNATVKQVKTSLNNYEKLVLHNMKTMKLDQVQAEAFVKSMGMNGEARDLKNLGLVN